MTSSYGLNKNYEIKNPLYLIKNGAQTNEQITKGPFHLIWNKISENDFKRDF